jgi:hypothetical protein
VADISYAFNANEFPNLTPSDKTSKSTVTTAHDTTSFDPGTATAVSEITEGYVSHTVKFSISEFENMRKSMDEVSETCMSTLEKQMGDIHQQVETMAKEIREAIVKAFTADDGIIAQQYTHIINLDKKSDNQDHKLNMMASAVSQMATSIVALLARYQRPPTEAPDDKILTASPERKIRRTEQEHVQQTSPTRTTATGTKHMMARDHPTMTDSEMEILPPKSPLSNQQ